MARRRRGFYARDRRGRFAKTSGAKGVYKKKLSTKKKVAIGGAIVVGAGVAAIGGRELYRAGGRKGYEYGKKQGIYETRPRREKGRFSKRPKVDTSQNPFEGRNRPVGPMGVARPRPSAGTRVRAASVALNKVDQNFSEGKKRTDGMHVRRRNKERIAGARRGAVSAAKRFNDAQSRSQTVSQVRQSSRDAARAGRRVSDGVRLQSMYVGESARNRARRGAANVAASAVIITSRPKGVAGTPVARTASPFPAPKRGKARSSKVKPSAKRNQRNRKRKK